MRDWILKLIGRMAPFGARDDDGRPRRGRDGPITTCTRVKLGTVTICGGDGDHRMEIERIFPRGREPDYRLSLQCERGGEWETLLVLSPEVVEEFKALMDESVRFIGPLDPLEQSAGV
jgi:hypothetical protein